MEINMEIPAHFEKGRCYFGTFNKENDVNSKTKRSGLNFFRFNTIGYLLNKLGFALKVHYVDGDKHGVVYLHPKSFSDWKERHKAEAGLNFDHTLSQKKYEEAIKIICDNFLKKGSAGWNIPSTYEAVIVEAEKQFTNNPFKNEILEDIKLYLEIYKKKGHIQFDSMARIFEIEEARQKHQNIAEGIKAFFDRHDLFPDVKKYYAE